MPVNRQWKVIAQDYNAPLLYNYLWVKGEQGFPKLLKAPSPLFSIISRENSIQYLADMEVYAKCHEVLKQYCLTDQHYYENLIDKIELKCQDLIRWTEKELFTPDVHSFTNNHIVKLVNQFIQKQGDLVGYGLAIPILDFGDFTFLETNLKHYLASKVSGKQYDEYHRVFTAPIQTSFSMDQEEDLLRLMSDYYPNKQWRNDVENAPTQLIAKKHPQFWRDLQSHTMKHGWVYYVYAGPAFDEAQFLEFIQGYLSKRIDPLRKLAELAEQKHKISDLRTRYIHDLKPDSFNEMIIRLAGKVVWAKPRRKDYQSKGYYHMEKLMREVGRRLGLSLRQARSIPPPEFKSALDSGHVDTNRINALYRMHVIVPSEDGTVAILESEQAEAFIDTYLPKASPKKFDNEATLTGNRACAGFARGVVRIINQTADIYKMQDGDILVAIATTPAIVPAMKKAAAIVTDEGGLTCHAAIVSRELNIPCIVGTKIATKVFKDGDMIEVDANKGIVRKIKGTR